MLKSGRAVFDIGIKRNGTNEGRRVGLQKPGCHPFGIPKAQCLGLQRQGIPKVRWFAKARMSSIQDPQGTMPWATKAGQDTQGALVYKSQDVIHSGSPRHNALGYKGRGNPRRVGLQKPGCHPFGIPKAQCLGLQRQGIPKARWFAKARMSSIRDPQGTMPWATKAGDTQGTLVCKSQDVIHSGYPRHNALGYKGRGYPRRAGLQKAGCHPFGIPQGTMPWATKAGDTQGALVCKSQMSSIQDTQGTMPWATKAGGHLYTPIRVSY